MKAKNILKFLAAAIFIIITLSCQNAIDTQSKKANITVQLCSDDEAASRTIMPSYQNSDLTSIVLSGKFGDEESKVLKEWDSYADMQNAEKGKITDIDIGDWEFSVECKIGEKIIFTGTLSKTLAEGDNTLSFTLENADGAGAIEAEISFECDTDNVKAITAKLASEEGKDIEGFTEQDVTLSEKKAVYTANNVPKGAYIVIFTMYSDEAKTDVITKAPELVSVAAGLVSKGTVTVKSLNKNYSIKYNLNGAELTDGVTAPVTFMECYEVALPVKKHFKTTIGYLFKGWYTTSTFDEGTQIEKIEVGTTKDVELWAKCEEGYELTIAQAATIIATLPANKSHNVKITPKEGETLDSEKLKAIKNALSEFESKIIPDTATVKLDLSETEGLTSIADSAFENCSNLESISLPATVTSIGNSAFNCCSSLKSVTIPDSVETIGGSAFTNCDNLAEVTIGKSVESIGDHAFASCKNLTEITIPDSVETIGVSAFDGCSSLENVIIGKSVKSIVANAFLGCEKLTNITVEPDNPNFSLEDMVLFNNDKTTLIAYLFVKDPNDEDAPTEMPYTIPDSVKTIGKGAFYSSGLTSITFGANVESIGDSAFYGCESLTEVIIPDTVKTIGENAFEGSGLTKVTIGKSVESIEAYTFSDCRKLTEVTIGESVTTIGAYAFYNTKLAKITIPASVTTIREYAFKNSSLGNATFEAKEGWKAVQVENSNDVQSIGAADLENNESEAARFLRETTAYGSCVWTRTDEDPPTP